MADSKEIHDVVDAEIKTWPDDLKEQVGTMLDADSDTRAERMRALRPVAEYRLGLEQKRHDLNQRARANDAQRVAEYQEKVRRGEVSNDPSWAGFVNDPAPNAGDAVIVEKKRAELGAIAV